MAKQAEFIPTVVSKSDLPENRHARRVTALPDYAPGRAECVCGEISEKFNGRDAGTRRALWFQGHLADEGVVREPDARKCPMTVSHESHRWLCDVRLPDYGGTVTKPFICPGL